MSSILVDPEHVYERSRAMLLIDWIRLGWPALPGRVVPVPPGLPVLRSNSLLDDAAQRYAQEMADQQRFSHQGARGDWHTDRIAWSGYRASMAGEDIAWGQTTPEQVVGDWVDSPGHFAAIVNPAYADFGVGCAHDRYGRLFWVADFARPG